MNVLEKILEEIEELKRKQNNQNQDYRTGYFSALSTVERIICSRMDEVRDMHGKRLIDADLLMRKCEKWLKPKAPDEDEIVSLADIAVSMIMEIEEQPTVYVNDGWIPVEERLPEDCEEIVLVQVSGKMAENIWFDNAFELATYVNGEGCILENYPECENPKVIAWQPLPEPYKPKKDITASGNRTYYGQIYESGVDMKRKHTSDERKIERNSHYDEMETNKPPNKARAAFKRDVRKEYGVKQCLTKWGVNLKGVIADGQNNTN